MQMKEGRPTKSAPHKIKRRLAYPLAIGEPIILKGRVQECASLIGPGDRLLDIGCSSGWLGPLVISKGFNAYVGIDRVIVGLERPGAGMTFVEGSVLNLPFGEKNFDAVSMFDVIEHLPKGEEGHALREAHRVLRPGGRLYFSTPHASALHTPLDPAWLLGHRHYRRSTIRSLLGTAGFTVDRLFVAGGLVECLDHIRLLVYKHVLHRPFRSIDAVNRLIERAHGSDRPLGMTVFAIASRSR
jgi:SAM-dependent methyltransferase